MPMLLTKTKGNDFRKELEYLEVGFEDLRGKGSLRIYPYSWWSGGVRWDILDDVNKRCYAVVTTFDPFTMDDHGSIRSGYGHKAYSALKAVMAEFARHLRKTQNEGLGRWETLTKAWDTFRPSDAPRAPEGDFVGRDVACLVKGTFDARVESVSSLRPTGSPVPGGEILFKEDRFGTLTVRPEMLKAVFKGKPSWYGLVWGLMTFDPDCMDGAFFDLATIEDVRVEARNSDAIPDVLREGC